MLTTFHSYIYIPSLLILITSQHPLLFSPSLIIYTSHQTQLFHTALLSVLLCLLSSPSCTGQSTTTSSSPPPPPPPPPPPLPSSGTYIILTSEPQQIIKGLGVEIQSDSIGSGNEGLPDKVHFIPFLSPTSLLPFSSHSPFPLLLSSSPLSCLTLDILSSLIIISGGLCPPRLSSQRKDEILQRNVDWIQVSFASLLLMFFFDPPHLSSNILSSL